MRSSPALAALVSLTCFAGAPDTTTEARDHAEKGVQYAQAGDLVSAETELRRAVDLASNDVSYLTSLGGILGMQQKLGEANIYFERAVKADPTDATARRNLAANQWRLGQLKPAQANLERLLRIQPQDKVAMLLLGMVSENAHDYARASKLLAAVPELVAQRPESVAALASSYYHTGRREEARKTLQTLLGQTASLQGIFVAASVATQAQDYEIAKQLFAEAARALESAIRLEPAKESNYHDLVTILTDAKRLSKALEVARKATEAFPKSELAFRAQGMVEMKMNLFTDAVRSYSRAIALDPKSLQAAVGLASARWSAGQRAEAEAAFQTLLKQHPRDATLHETLGTLLLAGATDDAALERAAGELRKAVALDGSRAEPQYQLGVLELKKPDSLRQALDHLEAALRLGLNESRVHYALARVYRRLGRADDAAKEMSLYEQEAQEK